MAGGALVEVGVDERAQVGSCPPHVAGGDSDELEVGTRRRVAADLSHRVL
jgi:hypothetical protein